MVLGAHGWHSLRNSEGDPFLASPEIRSLWALALDNQKVVGKATHKSADTVSVSIPNIGNRSFGGAGMFADIPLGAETEVRICDLAADHLSIVRGFPEFVYLWPVDKRDATIQKLKDILHLYGHSLRGVRHESSNWIRSEVRLEFPLHNSPATEKEVAQGDAIFHLDEAAHARVVPLPAFPVRGHLHGKRNLPVWIWQAEEVDSPSGPQRFYGIVSRHEIAKVPASEVELEKDAPNP